MLMVKLRRDKHFIFSHREMCLLHASRVGCQILKESNEPILDSWTRYLVWDPVQVLVQISSRLASNKGIGRLPESLIHNVSAWSAALALDVWRIQFRLFEVSWLKDCINPLWFAEYPIQVLVEISSLLTSNKRIGQLPESLILCWLLMHAKISSVYSKL